MAMSSGIEVSYFLSTDQNRTKPVPGFMPAILAISESLTPPQCPKTENRVTLVNLPSTTVFGSLIISGQLSFTGFSQVPLISTCQLSRSSLPGCPSAQNIGVFKSLSLLKTPPRSQSFPVENIIALYSLLLHSLYQFSIL